MNIKQNLAILWLIMISGVVAHTLLGMLPLFFGQSIAAEGAGEADVSAALWITLAMFLLPLIIAMLLVTLKDNGLRWPNLVIAALFLLLNLTHPLELIGSDSIPWHQLVLMLFMIVLNALLVKQSWHWLKTETTD